MAAATGAAPSSTDNTEGNHGVKRPVVAPRERDLIFSSSVPQHETFDGKAPTEPPAEYKRVSQEDERIRKVRGEIVRLRQSCGILRNILTSRLEHELTS